MGQHQNDRELARADTMPKVLLYTSSLDIPEQRLPRKGHPEKNEESKVNSGRRAGIVLAGRGIGPTTASRVLRKHTPKEDDLYLNILKAEREFERTRMFWD